MQLPVLDTVNLETDFLIEYVGLIDCLLPFLECAYLIENKSMFLLLTPKWPQNT